MSGISRGHGRPLPLELQRRLRRQLTSIAVVALVIGAGWLGVALAPILDRILVILLAVAVAIVLAVLLIDFFRSE